MRNFEYKAIPAPNVGTKAKGVKTTEDRFALSLTEALNEMAADGWEYVRAETLPCQERKGLTGSQTTYQNTLIFRRLLTSALPLTEVAAPAVAADPEPLPEPEPEVESEPNYYDDFDENDAPSVTAEPPREGSAPPVRAYDD